MTDHRGATHAFTVSRNGSDDGTVGLDLQQVFGRCYETGPYQRRLDYRTLQVEPPLTAERAKWAEGLIAAK